MRDMFDGNYIPQFENNGHTAPYNDGNLVRALYNGTYEEDMQKGYCYSVNLVDFVKGIEPYNGCKKDMPGMYDYDDRASRRALNEAISVIKHYLYELNSYEKYGGDKPSVPEITIYRAVPPRSTENDKIGDGEWISLSKSYAEMHGDGYVRDYHIQKAKVPANHIYWDGQHLCEFGYDSRTIDMTKELDIEVCKIEKEGRAYNGIMDVNGTNVHFRVEYNRVFPDRKSPDYPLLNARHNEINEIVKDTIEEYEQMLNRNKAISKDVER